MTINGGEARISVDLTVRQARQFASQTPDGRISARERRALQDPAELSAQGQRLALQSEALGAVRESIASGDALLDTAEDGLARVEQILDELRALSARAARDDISAVERAALNEKFQDALAELDRLANRTSFNGQTLLDAEIRRFIPVGTDELTGVKTVDGGTGTFTAPTSVSGTGLRDIRFRNVELAPAGTVTNNGFTFPDIREFSLAAVVGSPTPPSPTNPQLAIAGVRIATEDGTTGAIFTQGGNAPALTATTTAGGDLQIGATRVTTVDLPAAVGTGTARVDLSGQFALTLAGPAPATSAPAALAGEAATDVQLRVGTGNVPGEDEITASIGGVTPGALALRDVSLRGGREVNRAERLVAEAQDRLALAQASVRGDGQRLSEADDNARTQREGTVAARDAITGQPDTESVSKQVADNIVNQVDLGIGLLGDRTPETVFERLF
jgi:flagellin